jgi:hypothetical protein
MRPVPAHRATLGCPAGLWWQGLRHELGKVDAQVDTLALGPLADFLADRQALFAAARDRFAAVLGVAGADRIATPSLTGQAWGLVLTVHMAALVPVDAHQHGRQAQLPADPAGLSAYLLDREQAHWQALHANQQVSTPPQILARAVYT